MITASQLAQQLLHPTPLDWGLRSGLFLSGDLFGTTFLHDELIPELEREGALVIYIDLRSVAPGTLFRMLRDAITKQCDRFDVDVQLYTATTVAEQLQALVTQVRVDIVLIADHVHLAALSGDGDAMMKALKSARDAINLSPKTPGHFILVGVGPNPALMNKMVTEGDQAFLGATLIFSG